jgi:outer membrane protein
MHSHRIAVLLVAFSLCCQSALGQSRLNFELLVTQSVARSFDLKLAQVDTSLSLNEIKQSKVAYYPILRTQSNIEYMQGFQNGLQQIAVIGNSSLPSYTRFQEAFTLSATYTVCDFGIRKQTLLAARQHAQASQLQQQRLIRDLKLEIVDIYAKLLSNYKGMMSKKAALTIYQQMYKDKQRLYAAGTATKVDVAEQSLKVAKALDEFNQYKQSFVDNLQDLSLRTQVKYDPDDTIPEDFSEPQNVTYPLVAENTPDARYYVLEIAKAKRELIAIQRQRYPQIGAYTSYTLYGYNQHNPFNAFGNFQQKNAQFGFSAMFSIFDGFKNRADVEKKKLEIRRLEVERDQKLWELSQRQERLVGEARLRTIQLETRGKILSNGRSKKDMHRRLAEQQVTDKTQWLNEQAETIERQLQVDTSNIDRIAAMLKQSLLSEG